MRGRVMLAGLRQAVSGMGEALLVRVHKSWMGIGRWKVRRALRMPSERLDWHPDPTGAQKLRQAWCAVYRHDFMLQFDAVEDDYDVEHPGITRACRRCGLTYGWCLLHAGVSETY